MAAVIALLEEASALWLIRMIVHASLARSMSQQYGREQGQPGVSRVIASRGDEWFGLKLQCFLKTKSIVKVSSNLFRAPKLESQGVIYLYQAFE